MHTKFSANGYRLPDAASYGLGETHFFAMGGRTEQSTVDPFSNEIVYAEEWPWGGAEEHPSDIHAVVPPTNMNPDLLVGTQAPNGYGLYDMIGNAAELGLGVSNMEQAVLYGFHHMAEVLIRLPVLIITLNRR